MLALGEKRQRELFDRLSNTYLKRDKADVLKNALTTKDERVVFCELSNVQKMIYQRILSLADYKLLRFARSPCDCGVNQEFFSGYRLMRNR
jgi:SNF2 family DNA or RNA helicase